MKQVLLAVSVFAMLTGCVSKKKYADLEARAAKAEAQEIVLKKLQLELEETRRAGIASVEAVHTEMQELLRRMEDNPPLPPEQMTEEQRRVMIESMQARNEERMQEMREQQMESDIDRVMGKNYNDLRMTQSLCEAALENYTDNQVRVSNANNFLVITVDAKVLFSESGEDLSESGKTFVNKLIPALVYAADLRCHVVGIAANGTEDRMTTAFQHALTLYQALESDKGFAAIDADVMTRTCAECFTRVQTNCDKIEIVFEANNDELIKAVRGGF